eukprot:TRINITY_DN1351_c0_g1_i1.p1 TRINITY_DN1351_c0_g1~~TRINITY_DN1351_c0_g1_i1.p1  ORF type:complete len:241 (+),score=39.56 TRINITY_DN1351_c0_g1_i1:50-772(+)
MFKYVYLILLGTIYCISCGPGEFVDDGICVRCFPGTYNPLGSINATKCLSCLPGEFSYFGADNCTLCPQGYYDPYKCVDGCLVDDNQPENTCVSCTYESQCSGCPPGFFTAIQGCRGLSCCLSCPLGYFCPSSGTVYPLECPENTYNDELSQKECKVCGFMQISDEGSMRCQFCNGFFIFVFFMLVIFIISIICCLNSKVESNDAIEIEKISFLWKKEKLEHLMNIDNLNNPNIDNPLIL